MLQRAWSRNDVDSVITARNRFRRAPVLAIASVSVYLLGACIVTWPLVLSPFSAVPAETESRGTVPMFNLWVYEWNTKQLRLGYPNYWDAPIFHPEVGTFALSEPQPFTGIEYAILKAAVSSPVLAYNVLLILTLTLNGVFAERLLRTCGASRVPSILVGLMAVALPFTFHELGAMQLLMIWPVLWAMTSLYSFYRSASWKPAVSLGLASAAVFLTCGYYALFWSLFLLLAPLFLLTQQHLTRRAIFRLGLGALLCLALAATVAIPQARVLSEYERDDATVDATSAKPIEYFQLDRRDWRRNLGLALGFKGAPTHYLYPGSALLVLALAGGYSARYTRNGRWVFYCATAGFAALVLSMSPRIAIGSVSLFDYIARVYPGFDQLRNVYRFGVFIQLFLLPVAGLGLDALWQSGRRSARMATLLIVLFGLWEVGRLPARLYTLPSNAFGSGWTQYLATQPKQPVAVLPAYQGERNRGHEDTTLVMLQSLEHGMPLLNGYSGFFPDSHERFRDAVADFPDDESIRFLQVRGVGYVVVRLDRVNLGELRSQYPQIVWTYGDTTHAVGRLTPAK
jgi:hypothetical protein